MTSQLHNQYVLLSGSLQVAPSKQLPRFVQQAPLQTIKPIVSKVCHAKTFGLCSRKLLKQTDIEAASRCSIPLCS